MVEVDGVRRPAEAHRPCAGAAVAAPGVHFRGCRLAVNGEWFSVLVRNRAGPHTAYNTPICMLTRQALRCPGTAL